MDLPVRRLRPAPHEQRVERPAAGIAAGLEHPGHHRGPTFLGHPRQLGPEWPVLALGERAQVGSRLPEVAREDLGEDDQVAVARGQLGQELPVGIGLETRGLLHEADPEAVPGGHMPRLGSAV